MNEKDKLTIEMAAFFQVPPRLLMDGEQIKSHSNSERKLKLYWRYYVARISIGQLLRKIRLYK